MKRRQLCCAGLLTVALQRRPVWAGSFEDFFTAVQRDDPRTIQELAARGFDLNTTDPKGQTGLLLAVRHGSARVMDLLVKHPGVKVDARNLQDETPLMLALLKGQFALAKALVARDADVNKEGWAPLHYAATSTADVAVEQIRWLLEHHAYIDAESPNGTTPLMMAAQYGTEGAVRVLLEEGADATARNQLGLTAADFARKAGRKHLVDLLASHAAKAPTQQAPRPTEPMQTQPASAQTERPDHSARPAAAEPPQSVVQPVAVPETAVASPLQPLGGVGTPAVRPASSAPAVAQPPKAPTPANPLPQSANPQVPLVAPPASKW